MSVWTIEPRDTLVFRDGRPMSGSGLQMTGYPMPPPSQVAGFVRTRCGSDGSGRFMLAGDKAALAELVRVPVRGPWLAVRRGETVEYAVPAPQDAVLISPEGAVPDTVEVMRLGIAREGLRPGEQTDLAEPGGPHGLAPLAADRVSRAKPQPRVSLWRWSTMERWLAAPAELGGVRRRSDLGVEYPPVEMRTNVAIDGSTGTAEDGKVFSVDHRRYTLAPRERERRGLQGVTELALVVACDDSRLRSALVPFAGERRLVHFAPLDKPPIPQVPASIVADIVQHRRARLTLITPAVFEQGWRPSWLLGERHGVRARLRAAAVGRPEVTSGWDLEKGKPKPTRRLAPAGAVYFLELSGGDGSAIERWIRSLWWQCVSDDEQARLDGFGLAVLGVDTVVDGSTEA